MPTQVPKGVYQHEYVVKKSRFIARVVPVQSREEVKLAVKQSREDYPDAGHHCWAYLLGKPEDASNAGMNDDGEPAGTAGRPILNILQHGHLGDILVIVIRYFGGIKLGAGGLVRAYGTATQLALQDAPSKLYQRLTEVTAHADFAKEQALRYWLGQAEGQVLSVDYSDRVTMTLGLAAGQIDSLRAFCAGHGVDLEEH